MAGWAKVWHFGIVLFVSLLTFPLNADDSVTNWNFKELGRRLVSISSSPILTSDDTITVEPPMYVTSLHFVEDTLIAVQKQAAGTIRGEKTLAIEIEYLNLNHTQSDHSVSATLRCDVEKPGTIFATSPDVAQVIYSSQTEKEQTLYLYNLRSGKETLIFSSDSVRFETCLWSPSGSYIWLAGHQKNGLFFANAVCYLLDLHSGQIEIAVDIERQLEDHVWWQSEWTCDGKAVYLYREASYEGDPPRYSLDRFNLESRSLVNVLVGSIAADSLTSCRLASEYCSYGAEILTWCSRRTKQANSNEKWIARYDPTTNSLIRIWPSEVALPRIFRAQFFSSGGNFAAYYTSETFLIEDLHKNEIIASNEITAFDHYRAAAFSAGEDLICFEGRYFSNGDLEIVWGRLSK